jgi:predicted transcriptional regulator
MVQTSIQISENVDGILATLSKQSGKAKEELIREAIEEYIGQVTISEDVLTLRRRARGIWKDRTDLPDFDAIRRSMDRELNWEG